MSDRKQLLDRKQLFEPMRLSHRKQPRRLLSAVLALACALPALARAEQRRKPAAVEAEPRRKPAAAEAEPRRKAQSASTEPRRKSPPLEVPRDPALIVDEKATATFKEGIAAFDRRDFEAARVAFLQTFALKPTAAVVRRNLGLAEIYSGHYLDGARRLARVLHTTDEGTADDRARMVESLRKAEAHLERVSVEVKQDGAEISIDGVDLGTSPLPFLWYVAPGGYDVNVRKGGYVAFAQSRVGRAGAAQHLRIVLDLLAPPAPPVREPVIFDVPEPSRPNPWLLLTGGALSVGSLAAGVAFTLAAAHNSDKLDRLATELRDFGCPNALQACSDLRSTAETYDQQRLFALGSFVAAGVTGVGTLLYGVLGGGAAEPSNRERIARPGAQRSKLSAGWDGRSVSAVWSGSF